MNEERRTRVQVLWGLGGMILLLLLAFAMSENRRAVRPRTVIGALALQILFGVAVLDWPLGKQALSWASAGVQKVVDSSKEGIDFLVGPLIPPPNSGSTIFAFQVLPIIVFVASLSAVLYHWNILQWVVRVLGGGLRRVLGTTQAESINATANIFLGQTEAPLIVRPYLARMTRSEFFAVMVGGLATVAGSVMVGYAMLGAKLDNLIAASFMAAPAGLLMAKIVMPETESDPRTPLAGKESGGSDGADTDSESTGDFDGDSARDTGNRGDNENHGDTGNPEHHGNIEDQGNTGNRGQDSAPVDDSEALETKPRNVIDAAATGASDGLKLALNVAAMLFAFISLIALLNLLLSGLGGLVGLQGLTFQKILGWVFSPIMVAIGVPWHEAVAAGGLVGEKLAINEFLAFTDFGPRAAAFSHKTQVMITFALTGFANFSSLAILLGGLGGLVPQRRPMIAKYGVRAVLAATLANLLSATIAGMLS